MVLAQIAVDYRWLFGLYVSGVIDDGMATPEKHFNAWKLGKMASLPNF
jgi:hypothetical protein